MNEIQDLKDRRDHLRSEAKELHAEMLPLEAVLESEETIEPTQERALRDTYNELKRNFDSRNLNADLLGGSVAVKTSPIANP